MCLPGDRYESALGDIEEEFRTDVAPWRGRWSARLWYWRQCVSFASVYLRGDWPKGRAPAPGRKSGDGISVSIRHLLVPKPRENAMNHLQADIKYATRSLWNARGFSLVAVLTLAIGIGANAGMFSLVNAVILRPLPYQDPDRLVAVRTANPVRGVDSMDSSPPDYFDWRDQSDSFEELAAYWSPQLNLTGNGEPERLLGAVVTWTLFDVFAVRSQLGRLFTEDEDSPGGEPVALISDGLWRDLVAWIIPKDALSSCFSTLGITWMPHKFNAARRHKFDKAQYRVIHWAEYNESLRQRGDLTIWVSEEAQSVWSAPRRTSRGGQRRYSDLAIETCLTLRTAYRLGLRQTQGLMDSIGTLMGLDIRVPDFSTLSRRANGLSITQAVRQAGSVAVHLVVDSTGLKIFGEGEWLAQKHKIKGIRRRWRKLHLGLDLASGAIVCADLTDDDVGDSTALPGLLDQLDAPVTGFLADGAYDGASTRDLLRERYGETLDVVIPPPKNAVIRPQSARDPTVRDRHITQIRRNGRMAWQAATGYNRRSRIETQIGRWKSVIGPKLKSRGFSRQITEIQLGQKVLNTMTALGRPVFERIA